jgi:hypothetical protein
LSRAIHAGMSSTGEPCDLARLKDVDPQNLGGYDLIGLGNPVIHAGELPNVKAFMNYMKSVDGKHAFAFCTRGTIPGYY